MDLREVISAEKANIKIGPWKAGKIPKLDFPLSKSAYRLGNSYRWCVVSFEALGGVFKCAVIFNAGKKKYEALLGFMVNQTLKILCSFQFHEGEPGWHCHASCDPESNQTPGLLRGPWVTRIPAARAPHRRMDFGVDTEDRAVQFALRRYRIETKGSLL
jgi:hypothetical protein